MNKMAGHPPTVAPSLITIFFTSTTRPVPAGCSPGISSHLPRVTKHPWRVGIRGSPGASRMPANLASKRLSWAKGRWEQFPPCWDNDDNLYQLNPSSSLPVGPQLARNTVKLRRSQRVFPVEVVFLFRSKAEFVQLRNTPTARCPATFKNTGVETFKIIQCRKTLLQINVMHSRVFPRRSVWQK